MNTNGTSFKGKVIAGMGAVQVTNTVSDLTFVGNPATTMEHYKKWSGVRKRLMDQKD